ncbi:MAG: hypothetical protein ACKVP0_08720 [Pirellulaceae bacterium]
MKLRLAVPEETVKSSPGDAPPATACVAHCTVPLSPNVGIVMAIETWALVVVPGIVGSNCDCGPEITTLLVSMHFCSSDS